MKNELMAVRDDLIHLFSDIGDEQAMKFIKEYFCEKEKSEAEQIEISRILKQMGVSSSFAGYQYLREMIIEAIHGETIIRLKELYTIVEEKYQLGTNVIDRGIRTAIQKSWDKADATLKEEIFGNSVGQGGRPTNIEFIANLVDYYHLNFTLS